VPGVSCSVAIGLLSPGLLLSVNDSGVRRTHQCLFVAGVRQFSSVWTA
jgi:hypothetical protein